MATKQVVGIQGGGYGVYGHDPIRNQRGTGCPHANKKKGIPGGAFLLEVTLLDIARARVGQNINLGIAHCTMCGIARHFVLSCKRAARTVRSSARFTKK